MFILAIETSCDDTGISIIKIPHFQSSDFNKKVGFNKIKILSNIVSSQTKIHAKYGGIYPFLAKREHEKNLPIVLEKVLKHAKICLKDINLIAVTNGPGLEPCLWVGINFAKKLGEFLKTPIIPVNHIEGHIFANFFNKDFRIFLPAIGLVVSGGHTQLILINDFRKYKILGETRDDAAGECFDKTARILGLDYPGGPAISKQAKFHQDFSVKLPRPMIYQKNYDFSFSGLKTAVLYDFEKRSAKMRKSEKYIQSMCFEIQQAIIDVLIYKTLRAVNEYNAKSIILAGGVAANNELRRQFKHQLLLKNSKLNFLVPSKKICVDNALMIAITAFFSKIYMKNKQEQKIIKAETNQRIDKIL